MKLDTGAGVSVISKETYKKHFIGTPLMPSNTRLSAYTGHPLKVHGQLIAHLKYQDQSADVPLIVVEGSGPSLFGRDWLSRIRLDWTTFACRRQTILTELHEGHPGIARMKSIARSRVWWPKIDQEIEKVTREYQPCNKTRRAPPASPLLSWSWPTAPGQRVHVDFATHQEKHYLIMVDAHSKWPEVIGPRKTTTADSTINATRNIFVTYGLPTQVVRNNGPPFQSAEHEEFLRQNGIQRILVSPHHPSSNGLAERFVQTFKYAMESSADDPASSIQRRIQNFLISYRSTPHATTGSSTAKLFLQRELRTRLSLVTPDIGSRVASQQDKMKSNHDKFAKYREIAVGDSVLARDHLSGQKWQAGTVVQQTSPTSFQVQLNDGRI